MHRSLTFPHGPNLGQVAANMLYWLLRPNKKNKKQMQNLMYDMLSEVQSCRGELDSHIHTLEKHVEELREGFKSLMPLLSSTLSTQNSSIRHLLREREVKTDAATGGADR